ncbi:MAG TPA: FkbM family methyltransferase, partial [Dongiaceae bacterium]|nr:FkbM family methyltransferase [Dongiaceae bacterium]
MKSVMIFWVYSAGQYATSVPLCEVAEHAALHGFNDEPMTVLCLHGYEFVPAADRARLREQNFILEDVAPLFQKIAARYPNLRKRYANHFFECFLRWIVLKEWSGNTPVLAWDADIFFNEKLSRLHAEFAGSTFTSSSTCFAALHDPQWLEIYEQQLNRLEQNPEAFLFDVFSKLNRLKVGGRHDFTTSFFGGKIEQSLNSLTDWTCLFDSTPEEMFVDYLVRQELLPCHLAKGQSEFLLCPQPLLLPQLAWHHPLPPGFAVKASGDSPRALSRTDCRYHVDGQQLAFLHFQGALFRACVTHQVFHHMLGNPIPIHDEYCPPDRRAGQECGPFFFCQQAATLEKLTRIMSPEQLRTRWGNPFSERDVARNYLIKSNISGVVQNYGQPTQQAKAVAATPITMSNSPNPARKLCLASCFLPLDAENSRWWKHFQDELAKQDMELVLLGTAPAADLEIRTIVIPLWLQGYSQIYGKLADTAILEAPLLQALAQRDQTWTKQGDRPLSEFTAGAVDCQQVLRTLLDELQPSVVLVWGTILPQSVILQQLAQQKGLPCWVIERGLLPDTLMIEMVGQVGQSELNWSFTLNQTLKAANETTLFHAAQQTYLARCETKYAQTEFLDAPAFSAKFNPQSKKLVAMLLQYDSASSFVPAGYAGARIHTTGFKSSEATMQHLAAAAAQLDCLVIVKPHPLDADDYSALETAHLRVVREVNLHSLIRAADVVACMASSTQFEALLYEKPLLLLARSPLANKGVAYEPRTAAELPAVLEAALQRHQFDIRMANGRRCLHFILKYFSVALTDTSHAVPKLCDLAAFIAQNAITISDERDVNLRLTALGAQLGVWEAAAKSSPRIPIQPTNKPTVKIDYQSHIGQDAWVAECLGFKRDGFFLDFGAFDGKTISNTYALEKDLGWRGICVEPNPRYYPQVCACRNCISVNVALWHQSRQQLRFVDAHGLSAIESFKETDINASRRQNATKAVIEVDTLNPNELLRRFNAPTLIDYLTLDVEGAEFDILQALDLKTYAIALMTIEHNHDTERQTTIRNYLAQFGYEVVQNRNDDFFYHRQHLARLLGGKNIDPVAAFQR